MVLRQAWTREEFILVLNLYYKLPYGKQNHTNKDVKELAKLIGRTDNSVALRLANFAACDPYILESGRHGMAAGAKACKPYWDEFNKNREALLFESEQIIAKLQSTTIEKKYGITEQDYEDMEGTDRISVVKTRVNQDVFRKIVLSNYNNRCALTGIDIPDLLVASHIKPWAICEEERMNPENGICLSSLYDACFDKGLIGFDQHYKVVLSPEIKKKCSKEYYNKYFGSIEKRTLIMPEEHRPNKLFLEWHMDKIFRS